jgi:hypothetical protein
MARALSTLMTLVLAPGLLAGCEGDLPRATEITSMRILGARLEVEGDETRTTPKPGERLRVSLPIVFPTLDADRDDMRSMFIGCTAPDRFTGGLPVCQEIIDAVLAGEDVANALPMLEQSTLSCSELLPPLRRTQRGNVSLQCVNDAPVALFDVRDDFEADALLMLGVVCERGDPYIDAFDPLLFGCEFEDGESGEVLRVQGIMTVQQRAADENRNPSLDALTVLREGVDWEPFDPAEAPPERGCAPSGSERERDPALHSVVPGAHEITLRYDAEAREQVEGEPEDLELTVYTTVGEMERRFTLFYGTRLGSAQAGRHRARWSDRSLLHHRTRSARRVCDHRARGLPALIA